MPVLGKSAPSFAQTSSSVPIRETTATGEKEKERERTKEREKTKERERTAAVQKPSFTLPPPSFSVKEKKSNKPSSSSLPASLPAQRKTTSSRKKAESTKTRVRSAKKTTAERVTAERVAAERVAAERATTSEKTTQHDAPPLPCSPLSSSLMNSNVPATAASDEQAKSCPLAPPKCKRGQVLRETHMEGDQLVCAQCVEDRSSSLKVHPLTAYGYDQTKGAAARHEVLNKAIEDIMQSNEVCHGYEAALALINKLHIIYLELKEQRKTRASNRVSRDMQYLRTRYALAPPPQKRPHDSNRRPNPYFQFMSAKRKEVSAKARAQGKKLTQKEIAVETSRLWNEEKMRRQQREQKKRR